MAPSTYLIARQQPAGNGTETPTTAADVPECVLSCMASGDLDSCASPTDYTCLCQSTVYSSSVLSCWTANCTPTETEVGVEYSNYACQAFGVTPTPDATNSTTNSTTADPTTTNRLTAPTLTDATSPELYNKAFLNVQAIMSSICGALLLAAICLGLLACRSRIRRDRELAQRSTWTGVGTTMYGTDTKLGQKSHLFSRNTNGGSNANNFGVTSSNFGGETTMSHTHPFGGFSGPGINRTTSTTIDEMMEDDEDEKKYGISKAYRGTRVSVNRGFRGTGFTNRLTTTDADSAVGGLPGQESWEMTLKSGPSSSNGSINKRDDYAESTVVADSPTDSVTRMGDSTIDLGSTTQLNRVPYDGNRGNAI